MTMASKSFVGRKRFDDLATDVARRMEPLSFIHVGFLFRSHIEDFVAGVYFLIDVLDSLSDEQRAKLRIAADADLVHKDLKSTLRRLCELSREATFATDPARLPKAFCDAVDKMFQFVVILTPPLADDDALNHVKNMRERTLHPVAVPQ